MSFDLLERVHGHLAMLGLALLVHPLVLLVRGDAPRARRVMLPTALLLVAATLLGWWIYPDYRSEIKPLLRVTEAARVPLFEIKEHLAWLAVVLTLGAAGLLASGVAEAEAGARALLMAAVACGLLTAALGVWVAAG